MGGVQIWGRYEALSEISRKEVIFGSERKKEEEV